MKSTSRLDQCQSLAEVRLRKHADYQRAYASARKRQSASMSWFLAPQPPVHSSADASADSEVAGSSKLRIGPRIGLTVGKVLGKATDRNRIKRRMREALRRHVDLFPQGFDLIFHPRRTVLTIEFLQLEAEIVRILQQARELISTEAARTVKPPAPVPDSSATLAS